VPEEDTSTAGAEPEPIEILHMGTFADGKSVHGAAEVFDILRTRFRQARWAFRGHTDEYWSLSPSIERISHLDHATLRTCERYLRREFRRRAHQYVTDLPPKDDHLEWLALMQHHGVPTRLINWTESPYVAAFFAAFDKPDPFKIRPALSTTVRPTRSAIWVVDLDVLDGEARRILQTGGHDFLGEDLDWIKNEIEDLPAIIASVKPFRTISCLSTKPEEHKGLSRGSEVRLPRWPAHPRVIRLLPPSVVTASRRPRSFVQ